MKKLITVLLAAMLLVSMLPMAALAEDAEPVTMVPVAVQVPESWGEPSLWASMPTRARTMRCRPMLWL